MIDILTTGKCIDCPHIDLYLEESEFSDFEFGTRKKYSLNCVHQDVCKRYWDSIKKLKESSLLVCNNKLNDISKGEKKNG